MAHTPNSAARWPYLEGPATAANEYEIPPHGSSSVERIAGGRPRIPEDVHHPRLRSDPWTVPGGLQDFPIMSAPPEVPPIVARAFDVSRRAGYVSFCRNETGRLLAALAATRQGTMAEFGTGCGVGTAWLRSGARSGATILSAELDEKLAVAAQEIFEDDPQVEVLAADWSTLRNKGPYSLLFLDPSSPEDASVDSVADLVEPGGIVVMDDFTPCEAWPPITAGRVDVLRERWLTDERFTAAEVMVAPDASALIATRT
jgi:predicted O-methyltransferase YrrM